MFIRTLKFIFMPPNPDYVTLRGITRSIFIFLISELLNDLSSPFLIRILLRPLIWLQGGINKRDVAKTETFTQPNGVTTTIIRGDSSTLLENALIRKNLIYIQALLEAGAAVTGNTKDAPLHKVSQWGTPELIELLAKYGANKEAIYAYEDDCFNYSTREYEKVLIEKTPIFSAISAVTRNVNVEAFIKIGANVNATNGVLMQTPLHVATSLNNIEAVSLLIQAGANTNAQDINGETPLHTAARYCKYEIVKLLLNANAELNIQNKGYKYPIDCAIQSRIDITDNQAHVEILTSLIPHSLLEDKVIGYTILHRAVREENLAAVRVLIAAGADINAQASKLDHEALQTPLHLSIDNRNLNLDIVQALVDAGANVEALDRSGRAPIHYTIHKRNTDVLSLLINSINTHIINPGVTNDDMTALHCAISDNVDIEIIEKLIALGADVNSSRLAYDTRTALQLAILKNNVPVIQLLAKSGANTKAPIFKSNGIIFNPAAGSDPITDYTDYYKDLFEFALAQNVNNETLWAIYNANASTTIETCIETLPTGKSRPLFFAYASIKTFSQDVQSIFATVNSNSNAMSELAWGLYWSALKMLKVKNRESSDSSDQEKIAPYVQFCDRDGDGAIREQILYMLWGESDKSKSIIKAVRNKLSQNIDPVPKLTMS